jgi:7,8-dihydroneopterin aldolase/epimerase/oxygenase
MDARIVLQGIRAKGRHGANPGETDAPQTFGIDLDVWVDVQGDDLERTVDYRDLKRTAVEVIEGSSVALLETLARQVADAVAAIDGVSTVTARVHKPGAAVSLAVDDVAAEASAGD